MAALIVLALAEPVWNPRERLPTGGAALALVIDNGWASAPRLGAPRRHRRAADRRRQRDRRRRSSSPSPPRSPTPRSARSTRAAALDQLNAAEPRPVPVDRPAVYARVAAALDAAARRHRSPCLPTAWPPTATRPPSRRCSAQNPANVVWAVPDRLDMVGLTAAENEVDGFTLTAIRAPGDPAPASGDRRRLRRQGPPHRRRHASPSARARPPAPAQMAVPFELRNDFASIALDGEQQAGGRARARRERQAPPRRPAVAGARPTRRSRCCRRSTTSAARCSPSPISSSRRARTWPRRSRSCSSRSRR